MSLEYQLPSKKETWQTNSNLNIINFFLKTQIQNYTYNDATTMIDGNSEPNYGKTVSKAKQSKRKGQLTVKV